MNSQRQGSIVILVIVLVISALVLGGLFVYQQGLVDFGKVEPEQATTTKVDQTPIQDRSDAISAVENGDKISDIEKDLSGTNVDTLDQEVLGVKAEAEGL